MGIELRASGKGSLTDKSRAKVTYPLRGLPLPLNSGLNNNINLRQYFFGRSLGSLRPSEELVLKRNHPKFYKELVEKDNN